VKIQAFRTVAQRSFGVICLTAALISILTGVGCGAEQAQKGKKQSMILTSHPGKIKFVDLFTNTSWDVPVEDIPDRNRFVYLKNGTETANQDDATERVPIVEVEMLPLDKEGNLVSKDKATTIQIREFGPNRQPLRSSTMVKD